ncbi:girdin-like [Schistocerca gregaria]|uniref:girdin-like n=1 Tax=Schistocerca gregaria TaxID=7010 RepID=UPI00211E06B9|nr:girdin-like [Schistocerca gregaria]
MESGMDSFADSDNINTSTPWKLRFIKSPVLSSSICKQVDTGFQLFVSGLQEKVLSAENSLTEDSEEKIQTVSIKEQEGLPCDDIGDEKTIVSCSTEKETTSTTVSSVICSQTTDTLPSAKLWKPFDMSYGSFIVLDETIMSDESNEEDSFKKCDENFAKNISGILPLDTAKLVYSPKFDATKSGIVTNLILDDGKNVRNEVKSKPMITEENVLKDTQNVALVTLGLNRNENNTREREKNVDVQNNPLHSAEAVQPDSVSNSLVTDKFEPNATSEQILGSTGKNEQVISTDQRGDKLGQIKSDIEETGKIEQMESKSGDTEHRKSDSGETGKLEQMKCDNLGAGQIEQVKCEGGQTEKLKSDVRDTEKTEKLKPASGIAIKTEVVKSESLETEQVKHDNLETVQVKSDNKMFIKIEQLESENLDTEQVKLDNLETEQLKSDNEVSIKSEKVKFDDETTTEQVKPDNGVTGKIEQVKPDNGVTGKIEHVKPDNGVTGKIEQVKPDNGVTGRIEQMKADSLEIVKIEQMKSGNLETLKIEQVKSDNLETGKTEHVKPDSGEFVSSDPEENADNNNPEWELLKKLETDEERYKAVRLRWRNLVIPNPNKNLTYRSRGYWITDKSQKQISEVKPNPVVTGKSRKRTHSADPTEHHVPVKRQRTFSCTEVFDRKMLDVQKNLNRERNAILQQHERAVQNLVNKTNHQLRCYSPGSFNDERIRALHVQNVVELRYKCDNQLAAVESESMGQLRALEKAMEEVRVFNSFYQGLEEGCDDALFLTDEQLLEVLEEDHLYECFNEFYNDIVFSVNKVEYDPS